MTTYATFEAFGLANMFEQYVEFKRKHETQGFTVFSEHVDYQNCYLYAVLGKVSQ